MGYIKFAILLIFNIIACIRADFIPAIPFSAAELILIFCLSASVSRKNFIAGYFVNLLLSFLFCAQSFVLYFSGEFISSLMLGNINMAGNLGKDLIIYIIASIPAIGAVSLPTESRCSFKTETIWISTAVFVLLSSLISNNLLANQELSPLMSTGSTLWNMGKSSVKRSFRKKLDPEKILVQFRRDSIPCDDSLNIYAEGNKKSNVIIIFSEGMSAEVIDSYNNLNLGLTPALDSLHAHSLSFDNYYNHTAATFRGLRGQLYSSHQELAGFYPDSSGFGQLNREQMKKKTSTRLVSLTDILKKYGYVTYFINPEPGSTQTTSYMESFGTYKVTSGKHKNKETLTDKETMEVLEETVLSLHKAGTPFLVCCYNLGTHHGFDSPDVKYGNGKNPVLNKFHNYDKCIGDFLKVMDKNNIFDDTILIFTADHCSYPSPDFLSSFKSGQKYFVARIPMFIYTTGIHPMSIDSGGRNSLALAPTVINLLGNKEMKYETNWFLGNSLFVPGGELDNISYLGDEYFLTNGDKVEKLQKHPCQNVIQAYFTISINK